MHAPSSAPSGAHKFSSALKCDTTVRHTTGDAITRFRFARLWCQGEGQTVGLVTTISQPWRGLSSSWLGSSRGPLGGYVRANYLGKSGKRAFCAALGARHHDHWQGRAWRRRWTDSDIEIWWPRLCSERGTAERSGGAGWRDDREQ